MDLICADAVPEVIDSLPQLEQTQRCLLAGRLLRRLGAESEPDWRRWNRSRSEASRAVKEHESSLRSVTSTCPPLPAEMRD